MTEKYSLWQKVEMRIDRRTDLGYAVWVEEMDEGLLYANAVTETPRIGTKVTGYIVKIREDGKLDVSMRPQGRGKVEEAVDVILKHLRLAEGFLPLHDNSPPEQIQSALGMSKKTFKQAIGTLYRQKRITLEPTGVKLVQQWTPEVS
jgi:uncharacterized protein